MQKKLSPLLIGDVSIAVPIIQGGMGVRVSSSGLCAAVSNEGALGVIAAIGLGEEGADPQSDYRLRSKEALRDSIRRARELTSNPIGVNIMCAVSNYDDFVDVAQDEAVEVIISGAGLPLKLPALVNNTTTKLVPIVSSARAAHIVCSSWQKKFNRLPDALVVEGPLAGGHLGYNMAELADPEHINLDAILKDVLATAGEFSTVRNPIPVIAAGGIFDGQDIARVLKAGAAGVQMATRFVCTHECDAHINFKKAYLAAKEEDIVIIQSPVGLPGRVISNDFVKQILREERMKFTCKYRCLRTCNPSTVPYCIAKALVNAYRGNLAEGFAMCGSNAYRIESIISVRELVAELVAETESALNAGG